MYLLPDSVFIGCLGDLVPELASYGPDEEKDEDGEEEDRCQDAQDNRDQFQLVQDRSFMEQHGTRLVTQNSIPFSCEK